MIGGLLESTIKCPCVQNRNPRSEEDVLGEVAQYLPDKDGADKCLQIYLRSVQPMLPTFDRQDLINQYTRFWATFRHEKSFPQFTCMIFTICYCACMCKSEEMLYHPGEPKLRTEMVYQAEMDRFLKGAELSLRSCGFPARPTILTLAAACILQCVIHRVATIDNTSEIAQLVRVAQLMGLHRDATLFKNLKLSAPELKLRRILWFHMMCMDISGSVHNGLPPTVLDKSHDVKLPSENDGLDQDRMAQIFANGKYESLNLLGKLMHEIYGLRKVTTAQFDELVAETTKFEASIKKRTEMIRSFKFETRHPEINIESLRWLQKYFCSSFELLSSRMFCMLYHPSFSNWKRKRDRLIRESLKILRLYEVTANIPEFKTYLWYIRFGRPLHSYVLLVRDIYQHPNAYLHEQGREIPGVDGRIVRIEKAIAEIEFLQLYSLSSHALEQWKVFMKVKDFVWNTLPPEAIAKAIEAMQQEPISAGAGGTEDITLVSPSLINRTRGGDESIETSASPENGSDATPPTALSDISANSMEKQPLLYNDIFLPIATDFSDASGSTGDNVVEHLLNLDTWNIDWNAYSFDVSQLSS